MRVWVYVEGDARRQLLHVPAVPAFHFRRRNGSPAGVAVVQGDERTLAYLQANGFQILPEPSEDASVVAPLTLQALGGAVPGEKVSVVLNRTLGADHRTF